MPSPRSCRAGAQISAIQSLFRLCGLENQRGMVLAVADQTSRQAGAHHHRKKHESQHQIRHFALNSSMFPHSPAATEWDRNTGLPQRNGTQQKSGRELHGTQREPYRSRVAFSSTRSSPRSDLGRSRPWKEHPQHSRSASNNERRSFSFRLQARRCSLIGDTSMKTFPVLALALALSGAATLGAQQTAPPPITSQTPAQTTTTTTTQQPAAPTAPTAAPPDQETAEAAEKSAEA